LVGEPPVLTVSQGQSLRTLSGVLGPRARRVVVRVRPVVPGGRVEVLAGRRDAAHSDLSFQAETNSLRARAAESVMAFSLARFWKVISHLADTAAVGLPTLRLVTGSLTGRYLSGLAVIVAA
jgi:hypothetical protein